MADELEKTIPKQPKFEFTLTENFLTTNTGIVELTDRVQKMLDAIIRGMLVDVGTPLNHPVVIGYINMHGICNQIKAVFMPQQVVMSPEQIAAMQREAQRKFQA